MRRIWAWLLFLLLSICGSAQAARPTELTVVQKDKIEVDYRIDYRIAGVPLLKLAHVEVKLSEGQFTEIDPNPGRASHAVPALIVELQASPDNPENADPASKSRIFFRTSLKTVFDAETFQVLFYRKRVEERLRLPGHHTQKDYLEEVFYHAKSAAFYREDYWAKTTEEKEVDLSLLVTNAQEDLGFMDLPTMAGRAFFQPGFFNTLRQSQGLIKAQMITKSRMYHFFIRNSADRIKTPLTGKVQTTKSETEVTFRSLNNEVVPFAMWLAAPEDLPPPLGQALKDHQIYSLPASIRYKFTIGSLKILADSIKIDGVPIMAKSRD